MASYHTPVLLDEIAQLARCSHRIVDCTVGGGGHAEALLRDGVELLAIDRDPIALAAAQQRLGARVIQWLNLNFCDSRALAAVARFRPDFILLDLGVSGHQLDEDRRGFSFRPGTALDMRMTPGVGQTAAQLLRNLDQTQLDHIFRVFGDERRSQRLAATIVRRRHYCDFAISDDLVNAIRAALGSRAGPADFARLFQAVRIAVNGELEGLETALPSFVDSLAGKGVIAVVSYHSGEDRIVKHWFREWAKHCICPPGALVCRCRGRPLGDIEARKPIRPSAAEIVANPRARSAKLRVFRKADES
ncbi:MAG: 16S rRNA (cytosine(1402)-N(4))-methyltransferase RsmH [Gemmatimonadota bacterium]|nr:MAG: 16S rRNA (cytosine(1402)-N(4))-methyltransferase RsmH [Gemmatimonadota bacterium]